MREVGDPGAARVPAYRTAEPPGFPAPPAFGKPGRKAGLPPTLRNHANDLLFCRSGVAAGFLRSVEARCGVRVRGGARGPLHGLFMLQVKLVITLHQDGDVPLRAHTSVVAKGGSDP